MGKKEQSGFREVSTLACLLITDTEKAVVTGTTEARKNSLEHCSIELAASDWLRHLQS